MRRQMEEVSTLSTKSTAAVLVGSLLLPWPPRASGGVPPDDTDGRPGQTRVMRPLAVHHVSINVPDVDVVVAFYTGVLGDTVRDDRPDFGFAGAWIDLGDNQYTISPRSRARRCRSSVSTSPSGWRTSTMPWLNSGRKGIDIAYLSPVGPGRQTLGPPTRPATRWSSTNSPVAACRSTPPVTRGRAIRTTVNCNAVNCNTGELQHRGPEGPRCPIPLWARPSISANRSPRRARHPTEREFRSCGPGSPGGPSGPAWSRTPHAGPP